MTKIAVPTRSGQVDEHFGHCEAFTIFTIGEGRAVTGEALFTPPPACGCKSNLIQTLGEMGVTTVIAGNMGQGAANNLRMRGFTVVRGAAGPVRLAVEAWLAGSLKDREELCMAHGLDGHQCHHGH